MTKPLLTIAIPTYNRASQLLRTVELLLPQLNDQVILKIFDNASEINIDYIVKKSYDQKFNINIYRNGFNIGASANILRCFEYCQTEWMWLLSDDDEINANAVETILVEISKYSNSSFINFKSNLIKKNENYTSDIICNGADELINKMPNFSNLLFMSVGVYKVSHLKMYIRTAYLFTSSFATHISLLFSYLVNNPSAICIYSSKEIVKNKEPENDQKWNVNLVNEGLNTMFKLFDNSLSRKNLHHKIAKYHPKSIQPFREVLRRIIYEESCTTNIISNFINSRSDLYNNSTISNFNGLFKLGLYLILFYFIRMKIFKRLLRIVIPHYKYAQTINFYQDLNNEKRL